MFKGAVFYALNSPKIVCRPSSKRICWESLQSSPDSLAELRGPLCGREGRAEKEGKARRERKGGEEGRAILRAKTKILAMAMNKDTRKLPV